MQKFRKGRRPIVFDRPRQSTIFKPRDRKWTIVDVEKKFKECLQKEKGNTDASTDAKTYGKSLWSFLGSMKTKIEYLIFLS